MYFTCRGPASTSITSTIVAVLVIFGHGSSRKRLRTFLPLHLTIVRVSIFSFRFVTASSILFSEVFLLLKHSFFLLRNMGNDTVFTSFNTSDENDERYDN